MSEHFPQPEQGNERAEHRKARLSRVRALVPLLMSIGMTIAGAMPSEAGSAPRRTSAERAIEMQKESRKQGSEDVRESLRVAVKRMESLGATLEAAAQEEGLSPYTVRFTHRTTMEPGAASIIDLKCYAPSARTSPEFAKLAHDHNEATRAFAKAYWAWSETVGHQGAK